MRVFVFVNRVNEIGYRQTTAMLIAAAVRLGHEVFLADVNGLSLCQNGTRLNAVAVRCQNASSTINNLSVAKFAEESDQHHFETTEICGGDTILIRTNPGRDIERNSQHQNFILVCQNATKLGVIVVNDPFQLDFFASKAAINCLPKAHRPVTIVARDFETALEFWNDAKCDCVVKPLVGSRGQGVTQIRSDDKASVELLKNLVDSKGIVIQHFVKTEELGDKRVVVLDGKLLEHGYHIAGIHRVPAPGEFRANIHTGATAQPLTLSSSQKKAALYAASLLLKNGIRLAGIDLVDDQVIEFNVFSTGGLYDANRFANFDFSDEIVQMLFR